MKTEIASEAIKAAPPVTVTAVTMVWGLTLNEWVAVATIAYIVFQVVHTIWRDCRKRKEK